MKTLLLFLALTAAAFVVTGCGDSHASVVPAPEPVPAAAYKEGHGIQLTPAARNFIGLEVADVGTRAIGGGAAVPAVPVTALLRTVKGDFVFVANGDWFLRTPVVAGAADATHVEIKDGLYEGDAVAIRGVRGLSLAEIQALNGGVGCADGH